MHHVHLNYIISQCIATKPKLKILSKPEIPSFLSHSAAIICIQWDTSNRHTPSLISLQIPKAQNNQDKAETLTLRAIENQLNVFDSDAI